MIESSLISEHKIQNNYTEYHFFLLFLFFWWLKFVNILIKSGDMVKKNAETVAVNVTIQKCMKGNG